MSETPIARPYDGLTPEVMLDAVETLGLRCDGRLLALNSYENRVYQIGIEESAPVVGKFYRPQRWSDEAILEEHAFALELAEREIPVVAPLAFDGATLHTHAGFRFALFPKRPGRAPELEQPDTLRWLGRFIGRIHAVGATRPFEHRPALTVEAFGRDSVAFLLGQGFIPPDLEAAYRSIAEDVLARVDRCFEQAGAVARIRLHGDCHPGNLLWSEDGPHFVDLDDARSGPAIQDLWMLLSGEHAEREAQLGWLLEGYRAFRDFDPRELLLVEALRTLRIMHYAAWLARRWDDPAFPASFPWFNTQRGWQDHVLALREQAAAMDEPPLSVG